MRAAKIIKFVLPAIAALVVPMSVTANESQARALLKTETRGRSSVSNSKLLGLVKRPVSAKGVHFPVLG